MNGSTQLTATHRDDSSVSSTGQRHARIIEPDAGLLERCRSGDRQAFQELVKLLMRPAYYHALALVGDPDDARDVSQEAFARAWRSIRRYDPARPFYAWYYVILKRQALNLIRSRHRRHEAAMDDDIEAPEQSAPEAGHQLMQNVSLVNRALAQMSVDDREIISMKDMHDLAYREIADLLNIPIGTVMSRLYTARVRFRQKMQESGYEHQTSR